jgi:hypothetical protein
MKGNPKSKYIPHIASSKTESFGMRKRERERERQGVKAKQK